MCRGYLAVVSINEQTHCFSVNSIIRILLHSTSHRPKEMSQAPCPKMAQPGLQRVGGRPFSNVSSLHDWAVCFQRLTSPNQLPLPTPRLPGDRLNLLLSVPGSLWNVGLTQPRGWLTLNSGIYTLHDHFAALSHTDTDTNTHIHAHMTVVVPVSLLSKGIWLD